MRRRCVEPAQTVNATSGGFGRHFGFDTPLRGFTSQSDVSLRRNGFAVVHFTLLLAFYG